MKKYQTTDIDTLANILKQDGILCVPTDTVYGLCAQIKSKNAFNKLVEVKNRAFDKSIPIMCARKEQIKEIAIVDEKIEKIIDAWMPGPLTLILNKKPELESIWLNNAGEKLTTEVAVRLAPNTLLKELIEKTGPIFMTSANLSNEKPYKTFEEVEEKLKDIDGFVEGNFTPTSASTILVCTKEPYEIQRIGPVTKEQIEEVLKEEKAIY